MSDSASYASRDQHARVSGELHELLAQFLSAAVGLQIYGIHESTIQLRADSPNPAGSDEDPSWTAWDTDHGLVWARALYDAGRSQHIRRHVVRFSWHLPQADYSEGWWHCFPTRPREWIKGRGR